MTDASAETETTLVTGVDFVAIPARDFDESVEFYGTTLGLPLLKRWGDRPGIEFQAGNLRLVIMDPTAFGQEFRAHSLPVVQQLPVSEGRGRLLASH